MAGEEPGRVVVRVLHAQHDVCLAGTASAVSRFGDEVVGRLLLPVERGRGGQFPCGKEQGVVLALQPQPQPRRARRGSSRLCPERTVGGTD